MGLEYSIFTADFKNNHFNVKDVNRFFLAFDRVRLMIKEGLA